MKILMISKEEVRLSAAFITTDGGGDGGEGGDLGSGVGEGEVANDGAGGETSGSGDDLSTIFSQEEIEAKRAAIEQSKAEETRRAALTDEERAAEDAASAEANKGNEVPETYEFQIPEGYTVDEELMTDVQAFAKENKMTAAAAQQIADLGAKLLAKQQEMRETQFNEIKAGWLETAKSDPEIGKDVSKGDQSIAARAFNTIATPEMKELVDQYGIGDHPEMLRMFYRLSSLMGDDKMHMPGLGGGTPPSGGVKETVGGIFNHPSRQTGNG